MIEIIGLEELEDFIWEGYQGNKIIVVYFGAPWCGPCQTLKEKINSDEAKEGMPDLLMCYINIDEAENQEIQDKYNVKSLPTQIFVSLEEDQINEIKRIVGYDWINFVQTYHLIRKGESPNLLDMNYGLLDQD